MSAEKTGPGYFELTVKVSIREDHKLVADPAVYENGSPAQDLLTETLTNGMTFGTDNGVEYADPHLVWVESKRILSDDEIKNLALDLIGDGPVRLPDGADELNTLDRLGKWHKNVHVAERTELDGILIHA